MGPLELPKLHKIILIVCGVIIVIGSAILLIDKFIVKRGEPSREEKLAAVEQDLGYELHQPYSQAGELMHISKRFEKIAPPASDIGAVMIERTDDYELFLYEHKYDQRALRTTTQSHSMQVELFGILFRFPGEDLPDLFVLPDGNFSGERADLERVFNRQAVDRLKSWEDFAMGTSGEFVLYIQRPPASALMATTERNTSDEFQPGLLNSGLKIDLQRAIDITNMLQLDRPDIASVYTLDTSDIEVKVDVPELDLGLDENVKKTHAEVDAIMSDFEADMEALRAEREAQSEQRAREREQRRAESQARIERMREESAERQRRMAEEAAARKQRMAERQAELERTLEENQAKLDAALNDDGSAQESTDGAAQEAQAAETEDGESGDGDRYSSRPRLPEPRLTAEQTIEQVVAPVQPGPQGIVPRQ